MKQSSSYQNINHKLKNSENKEKHFGSSDDFDSGFSSDENTREGKSGVHIQAKLFFFSITNKLYGLLFISVETIK